MALYVIKDKDNNFYGRYTETGEGGYSSWTPGYSGHIEEAWYPLNMYINPLLSGIGSQGATLSINIYEESNARHTLEKLRGSKGYEMVDIATLFHLVD